MGKDIVWFLKRWAKTYLLVDEKLYDQVRISLLWIYLWVLAINYRVNVDVSVAIYKCNAKVFLMLYGCDLFWNLFESWCFIPLAN